MAKVTEKDIINHLQEKIRFHQQERLRIEQLLSAFTRGADIQGNGASYFGGADANPSAAKVRKVKEKPEFKPLDPPLEYNSNLTIVNKIVYSLNKIGEGYNEDIANVIASHEDNADVKKISQLISGVLSTLKTNGLVIARKDGRKHKFSLAK
jgi:hypothetical protein